jgi:hypothetical protein
MAMKKATAGMMTVHGLDASWDRAVPSMLAHSGSKLTGT